MWLYILLAVVDEAISPPDPEPSTAAVVASAVVVSPPDPEPSVVAAVVSSPTTVVNVTQNRTNAEI